MLERWRRKVTPLTGAPQIRRQKTYSAATGYVYQYFYQGWRESPRGAEYVFEVSADRKTFFSVSVFVSAEALGEWERDHGRALVANERYAISKMALFQAFDERADPMAMRHEVVVRPEDAKAILDTLGVD